MMFHVCLFLPLLYVPWCTLVTISFKLYYLSTIGVMREVSRNTRVLMKDHLACGRFSIPLPLVVFFLARCYFHGSAEPEKLLWGARKEQRRKRSKLVWFWLFFPWVVKEAGCPAMAGKGL